MCGRMGVLLALMLVLYTSCAPRPVEDPLAPVLEIARDMNRRMEEESRALCQMNASLASLFIVDRDRGVPIDTVLAQVDRSLAKLTAEEGANPRAQAQYQQSAEALRLITQAIYAHPTWTQRDASRFAEAVLHCTPQ